MSQGHVCSVEISLTTRKPLHRYCCPKDLRIRPATFDLHVGTVIALTEIAANAKHVQATHFILAARGHRLFVIDVQNELLALPHEADNILGDGAARLLPIVTETMREVKEKVGLA
jgi:hypothetical protein